MGKLEDKNKKKGFTPIDQLPVYKAIAGYGQAWNQKLAQVRNTDRQIPVVGNNTNVDPLKRVGNVGKPLSEIRNTGNPAKQSLSQIANRSSENHLYPITNQPPSRAVSRMGKPSAPVATYFPPGEGKVDPNRKIMNFYGSEKAATPQRTPVQAIKGMNSIEKGWTGPQEEAPDNMTYLQQMFTPEQLMSLDRTKVPGLIEAMSKLDFEEINNGREAQPARSFTGLIPGSTVQTQTTNQEAQSEILPFSEYIDPISGRKFSSRRAAILGKEEAEINKDRDHTKGLEVQGNELKNKVDVTKLSESGANYRAKLGAEASKYGDDRGYDSAVYRASNTKDTAQRPYKLESVDNGLDGQMVFDPNTGRHTINGINATKYNKIKGSISNGDHNGIAQELFNTNDANEFRSIVNMIPPDQRKSAYQRYLKLQEDWK